MGTSGREVVLRSIQAALHDVPEATLPPAVSFEEPSASTDVLAERFCSELQALGGLAMIVPDVATCAVAVEADLIARNVRRVATQSSPLAQHLGDLLRGVQATPTNGLSSNELERFDASLVEARALVADTGSVILLASSYQDRLLPYLPRVCVVVAAIARLHATLDARALASIETAARSREHGEAVIVTGPSRTADIEKTLVLGAHGPAHLAVFLVRDAL